LPSYKLADKNILSNVFLSFFFFLSKAFITKIMSNSSKLIAFLFLFSILPEENSFYP
jgi:hypothetical protein